MKRREILKYTAYMTGAAVSLPLMSTLLSGCKTDTVAKAADFKLNFFTKDEFSSLKGIVDTILPKTNSPSASEVGVHKMVDTMVGTTYKAEDAKKYREGFDAFLSFLKSKTEGKNFVDLDQPDKIKILKDLDASNTNQAARGAYLELKQQTIAYYLNTEEIGTNYLNYLPVPGEYRGCIDLAEVDGKAWAI